VATRTFLHVTTNHVKLTQGRTAIVAMAEFLAAGIRHLAARYPGVLLAAKDDHALVRIRRHRTTFCEETPWWWMDSERSAKLPGPPARTLKLENQDGGPGQLQPLVRRQIASVPKPCSHDRTRISDGMMISRQFGQYGVGSYWFGSFRGSLHAGQRSG
jgi:hypothetical protein